MPRFFFDFHQAGVRDADTVGLELADAEQAYLEAFKAAQDMWGELLKQRRDPRRCSFDVHGEVGDILFAVPFQEVMDSCTDRLREPVRRTPKAATLTWEQAAKTHAYANRIQDAIWREIRALHRTREESRKLLEQASKLNF